ncbi:MAG: DUF928 domain-containing protein [Xenococcaceae cyanobacterium MO_188.B32]|nr:DUF928 domain-containing protein [Xenococcaceae cyanobacterium MO_188.B32]
MKIKQVLLIVFLLLGGGILFSPMSAFLIKKSLIDNYAIAQDTDVTNILSESSVDEDIAPFFRSITREEDQQYRGRVIGVPTFAECPATNLPPLTAFVPSNGKISYRAKAAKSNPEIWIYIPEPSDPTLKTQFSNLSTQFELTSDTLKLDLHPLKERITSPPGIIPIKIPITLNYNETENWSFTIICDDNDRSANILVDGHIERKNVPSPPNGSTPEDKVRYFGDKGLWHDALTTLIEDLCPQNPQRAKLLIIRQLSTQEIGLEEYAQEYAQAFIDYCHP